MALRVKTAVEFASALREKIASGKPAVVDVAVALDVSYQDVLSALAAG
jgi:thiamine pyrophosphate-dependent acetolactate synthase large subunit-like protein